MNASEQFLWVIYPYMVLTVFIVGHIYRYNTDQLGWTAKSSEFLEKKNLKWGSLLFHFGILAVVGGHVSGILIPKAFFEALGITDHMYHMVAIYCGGPAGILTIIGIALLVMRRFNNERIYTTSSKGDIVVVMLVLLEVVLGLASTATNVASASGFDYRETIAPWFRGLLFMQPDAGLMASVPLFFKLHVLIGFALFAVWPFTRLVHVWSVPIEYISRPYIQYVSRDLKRR